MNGACEASPGTPDASVAPDGSLDRDASLAFDGGSAADGGRVPPSRCPNRLTCADHGAECGPVPVPDGCGGTVSCGECPEGQLCGVGAERGRCGTPECTRYSCLDLGAECGPLPDGCGGVIDCGSCGPGQGCGVGPERGRCGPPPCVPRTCADYPGVNCGVVADGCGGLTESCGECDAPDICGGAGAPNVCGGSFPRGPGCVNLCLHQEWCPGGGATSLVGTVYAPNGTLPLPNVMVYVPNAALPAITSGVSCDRCEDEDLGDPLVGTISDVDGSFELRHVPAGVDFPLVIKIGKWRRVVTIPAQPACTTTALTSEQTRLPRDQSEGNIPLTAVATGDADAMECVLRKLGVRDSEFTSSLGTGRIHLYRENGGWPPGGNCGAACAASTLRGDQARLDSYDMVIWDCEGAERTRSGADLARFKNNVDAGGRAFLSHWSYDYIRTNPPLNTTADWTGTASSTSGTGYIESSFPRAVVFRDWLRAVGALLPGTPARFEITDPRGRARDVRGNGRAWVRTFNGSGATYDSVQTLTFNTPVDVPPADECGRVVYTGFHVAGSVHPIGNLQFPAYCPVGPLTAQEKVLAFMLFDLATCISGDDPPPPICTPRTCEELGVECGRAGDGCGGTLDCGGCPDGEACGAGGTPSVCGRECRALNCSDHGAECGELPDGCGGTIHCGDCTGGELCGAAGPGMCGSPCVPLTCEEHGAECGQVSDGCGSLIDCGECPSGFTCGFHLPNQCGQLV